MLLDFNVQIYEFYKHFQDYSKAYNFELVSFLDSFVDRFVTCTVDFVLEQGLLYRVTPCIAVSSGKREDLSVKKRGKDLDGRGESSAVSERKPVA